MRLVLGSYAGENEMLKKLPDNPPLTAPQRALTSQPASATSEGTLALQPGSRKPRPLCPRDAIDAHGQQELSSQQGGAS